MTHPDTLQRAAFEAWAASKHIDITRDGFGGYESQWTEGASEGWQAALQTQAAPCDAGAICLNCQPRGPNGECQMPKKDQHHD